jgi:predicted nucleotidyltransferase
LFEEILAGIARALDGAGLPYMVIGGQAVLRYGEPRLTKDIDITLGVGTEGLPRVEQVIRDLNLKLLVENPDAFVRRTFVLPAQDEASGIRVDFVFSFSDYEKRAIARAASVEIKGTLVRFATLEDVVVHKVVAGRPRDLEDVKSIILKNPGYDRAYVERWLQEFDRSLGESHLSVFRGLSDDAQSP